MTPILFDPERRRMARDRAARRGPELVLLDRAFDDGLERIAAIRRRFDRALLLGAPSPKWAPCLAQFADRVDVVDPGALFAAASGGTQADEDRFDFGEARYDLILAVGTLDTVNDLPLALQLLRRALRPDSPIVGVIAGGDTLSTLRSILLDIDRAGGTVAARTHPRIDGPTLAGLLSASGFLMPVIDIDRVRLRYRTLGDLTRDLRAMAAGNALAQRGPAFDKRAYTAATAAFAAAGDGTRTDELFDLIHFVGWSGPASPATN